MRCVLLKLFSDLCFVWLLLFWFQKQQRRQWDKAFYEQKAKERLEKV
jgi:hypothetical protein